MLELAMAEAYRPRAPKKQTPTSSSPSTSTLNGSTRTSSSASFENAKHESVRSGRKLGLSMFRKRDKKESGSVQLLASLVSLTMEVEEEGGQDDQERPHTPTPTTLPHLPPTHPLPSSETDFFDLTLQSALHTLSHTPSPTPHLHASTSLSHLANLSDIAARTAPTWCEFWAMIVHASKHLTYTQPQPQMSTAVSACLLRALSTVARIFNEEQGQGCTGTAELARIAGGTFEGILMERRGLGVQLGRVFAGWLVEEWEWERERGVAPSLALYRFVDTPENPTFDTNTNGPPIRILAFPSPLLPAVILHTLSNLPLTIHLTLLSSLLPHCSAPHTATQILSSLPSEVSHRLHITIHPISSLATATTNTDILLLAASRISPTSDVLTTSGSLAAAICTKHANPRAAVVVLSDVDKIAAPGVQHEDRQPYQVDELTWMWDPAATARVLGEGNIEVAGEALEWVPAGFVDACITEKGVVGVEEVERIAVELGELEAYIFERGEERENDKDGDVTVL